MLSYKTKKYAFILASIYKKYAFIVVSIYKKYAFIVVSISFGIVNQPERPHSPSPHLEVFL